MTQQTFFTIKQLAAREPAFTASAIRNYIFYSDINGLDKYGAINRLGGRILINHSKFIDWVTSSSKKN